YTLVRVWFTDVWGHLRFGEYIVETGELPTRESFSGDFADQKALYVNFQWLSQAGAYLVYKSGVELASGLGEGELWNRHLGGGALMLTTAQALIVTLRLIVLLLAFRRLTGSLPFALIGVIIAFGMGVVFNLGIIRPQILGELGFAILLLALSRPVLSRRALVYVPLVMVLWANCHGSFAMGLVLLGAALAGQGIQVVIDNWRPAVLSTQYSVLSTVSFLLRSVWRDVQFRRLALVLALSVVAVAILNPHGPYLYLYSLELANHANIQTMEEW